MKVLISGAAGYIGSVLVPHLLCQGHRVVAVDRFLFGRDTLPPASDDLTILERDIRSIDSDLFTSQSLIDAVIDLAALSNDPAGEIDPEVTHSINHRARVRVASIAKCSGTPRYILPSSCSVYGFQKGTVDETSELRPLTTYAKANRQAEKDVLALANQEFCPTILRLATVYGLSPRMRFDLAVNGMVRGFFVDGRIPILREGRQWRPFVHVLDVARAFEIMLSADRNTIATEIFNVGSNDQNHQIFELAERVSSAIGLPFEFE